MKVTHVNVRLSEGGAAMVARTLVDALPKFGVDTEFVYGYGPSGRKSPLEEQYKAARTTNRATVAINITSHSLTGREAISPLRRPSRHWFQAVSTSDIVHLHVIHSYMANPNRLLETLGEMGRPVVWTLHDQWAMTGRCAQPASCQKWRTGCGSCPDLSAYPPAKIDHSSREWRVRRSAIHNLTRKADVTTVACADWLAEEARRAGLPNVTRIHNSVDQKFWQSASTQPPTTRHGTLFMCRDLRDKDKVDWDLLSAIASAGGSRLTIIGDHSPQTIEGARHLAAISSRDEIAAVMAQHHTLIFTSKVDYHPLTIVEALAAGMHVMAIDSPAAREFQNHPRVKVFSSVAGLIDEASSTLSEPAEPITPDPYSAPQRMAAEYVKLYQEILKRADSK